MSNFKLTPTLTQEQLDIIDAAALKILKEIGVIVPHSDILEILNSKNGIEVDGNIVRFEPSLVKENIQGT